MKTIELDYGTDRLPVELPDSAAVVRYGETYTDPAPVDPVVATRAALDAPHGMLAITLLTHAESARPRRARRCMSAATVPP